MKTFFLFLSIFFLNPVLADTYNAYGMKMNLLSADIDINQQNQDYNITTSSKAKGMLAWFIHNESLFKTTGQIKDNRLIVTKSLMQNKNKKGVETVRVNFDDKPGFIDYQSVLLHLMCLKTMQNQELFITDGKRDMKIKLNYNGKKPLNYKHLSGTADAFSVRIDILKGKKSGWFFKRINQEKTSPLTLYMQNNTLVLATFDTGAIGTLYIVKEKSK